MTFATGIVAALSAPLTMTLGFIVWDNHWSGSAFALNMFKCNLASIGFIILSITTRPIHELFPPQIFTTEAVGFLMLSSVVGIIIGDWTWLEGLQLLGARRVIIMDSLKPFLAAILGWALLDEQLQPAAFGGMALTVSGVLLVSLEKESMPDPDSSNPTGVPGDHERNDITGSNNGPDEGQEIGGGDLVNTLESNCTKPIHENTCSSTSEVPSTALTIAVTLEDPSTYSITEETDRSTPIPSIPPSIEEAPSPPDNLNETEHEVVQLPPRRRSSKIRTVQQMRRGYVLAVVNVGLDTWGSVLTKEHGAGMTTWEINLIRFGFAGVVMLLCSIVLHVRDAILAVAATPSEEVASSNTSSAANGRESSSRDAVSETIVITEQPDINDDNDDLDTPVIWYKLPLHGPNRMSLPSWASVVGGVLFVTFITPALSNYALFQIALALALTLGSVGPLYAMPLCYLLQKDQQAPTLRAYFGALLAVAGIVVLAFRGTLEQDPGISES